MSNVPVYMQSMQQMDREELYVCPYDPVHRIRANRFVRHLLKCRKNFPNSDLAVCVFNARHVVPKPELQLHLSTCPDKRMIEQERAYERLAIDGDEAKGDTSVPPYNDQTVDFNDGEDWDREVAEFEQHRPSYRTVRTSTKYTWDSRNSEDPYPEESPAEMQARQTAQTAQPFPMERRPRNNPQLRSGVTGMGRGQLMKQQLQNQQKENKSLGARAGPTVASPSLAANFKVKPKVQEVNPQSGGSSARPTSDRSTLQHVERPRQPTHTPRFAEQMAPSYVTTREQDEEIGRFIDSEAASSFAQVPYQSPPRYSHSQSERTSSESPTSVQSSEDLRKREKRRLVKSLKQISNIEAKIRDGKPVNDDEKTKLEKKQTIEERLAELNL